MKLHSFTICFLALILSSQRVKAAAPSVSYDGNVVSLSAENGSFGQVLELFKQQTGLEYEIPPEMRTERLPLLEIKGLSVKAALLKVLEGCNYDYILVAGPANPEKTSRLLITGKSTKIAATASAPGASTFNRRMNQPVVEDPFGGTGEVNFEDAGNVQNDPAMNNPGAENLPQGAVPTQPGVQPGAILPGQANPGQPMQQPGVLPQQQLGQPLQPGQAPQQQPGQPLQPGQVPQQQPGQPSVQPQVLQPFPANTKENDRRSPY